MSNIYEIKKFTQCVDSPSPPGSPTKLPMPPQCVHIYCLFRSVRRATRSIHKRVTWPPRIRADVIEDLNRLEDNYAPAYRWDGELSRSGNYRAKVFFIIVWGVVLTKSLLHF